MIPVKVIKHSATILAPVMVKLFTYFISSGNIPSDFKTALVFPLFEKGDKSICDNYRGISVLSPLAKIFERILLKNINNFFVTNSLFSVHQHVFWANFSSETALQSMLEIGRYILIKSIKSFHSLKKRPETTTIAKSNEVFLCPFNKRLTFSSFS